MTLKASNACAEIEIAAEMARVWKFKNVQLARPAQTNEIIRFEYIPLIPLYNDGGSDHAIKGYMGELNFRPSAFPLIIIPRGSIWDLRYYYYCVFRVFFFWSLSRKFIGNFKSSKRESFFREIIDIFQNAQQLQ